MSAFTRQWLQLREPADHRARADFSRALRAQRAERWHVVDLGCGTGSNLRYLCPQLRAPQQWICIDNDSRLLGSLERHTTPAAAAGVETLRADLATDVGALIVAAFSDARSNATKLVSASALLDLVSAAWIDALVCECARMRVAALFALTWDGSIELEPTCREDSDLRVLMQAHQLRDKGFGPALGPAAASYARAAFERCGYRVTEARTPWQLNCDEDALQRRLLAGWIEAAREQSGDRRALAQWRRQRLAQIDARTLAIGVGHTDLLALPAPAPPSA